jgi:hypothetical protein
MAFIAAHRLLKFRWPFRGRNGWITLTSVCCVLALLGTLVGDWLIQRQESLRRQQPQRGTRRYAAAPPDKMLQWYSGTLELGSLAPDFFLPSLRSSAQIHLNALLKGKPLVLLFGSLSCPLFCERVPALEQLYQQYRARAQFLCMYVHEAGHHVPGLEYVLQAQESHHLNRLQEHLAAVRKAVSQSKLTWPWVIDEDDCAVEDAYLAYPLRLVVIDQDRRIALDLGHGFRRAWELNDVRLWLDAHGPR